MVNIDSASRLPSINSQVILAQTDTTVGFLSQDAQKLYEIKSREVSKPFIKVYRNFQSLKNENIRIPKNKKAMVRRAKKTTFIVNNVAFRVADYVANSSVLRALSWTNSTSANESGKNFDKNFCEEKADIIVEDKNPLFEGQASSLYKVNNKMIKRLR